MAAVQFYGEDSVMKAVENRDCPRWGMFYGRQFLFKYSGDSMEESMQLLQEIFDTLDKSGTVATYTLKFYEDAGKITEKTPCDGSFNFKLVAAEQYQERQIAYAGNSNKVLAAAEKLNERMDKWEAAADEEEEPAEPQSLNGVLIGLLKEPQKIEQLMNLGRAFGLFGGLKHMGAIGNAQPAQATGTGEDVKISEAIEILKQHDPKIADHLLKLAGIAQNNNAAFKYLLSMLDNQ